MSLSRKYIIIYFSKDPFKQSSVFVDHYSDNLCDDRQCVFSQDKFRKYQWEDVDDEEEDLQRRKKTLSHIHGYVSSRGIIESSKCC